MLGSHGLFDVLSMAGGTTPKSGITVTITHRSRPHDPVQVKLVDVGKSPDPNSEILPGDTVFVSKAGIVYVVGDVKNPSGIAIENDSDMTVLKAIAIAGGVNPTAAVSSAKLIRRTSNGPEETSIPLKKILSAKVRDLKLQPEDIIFVPNSAAKSPTSSLFLVSTEITPNSRGKPANQPPTGRQRRPTVKERLFQ